MSRLTKDLKFCRLASNTTLEVSINLTCVVMSLLGAYFRTVTLPMIALLILVSYDALGAVVDIFRTVWLDPKLRKRQQATNSVQAKSVK